MVTFETAKRLKDAGFPQFEINDFRFWYDTDGDVVFGASSESVFVFNCVAPSAIDILEQLPVGTVLKRKKSGFVCGVPSFWGDTFEGYAAHYEHYNAAEAAAAVWLHINEPFELKK